LRDGKPDNLAHDLAVAIVIVIAISCFNHNLRQLLGRSLQRPGFLGCKPGKGSQYDRRWLQGLLFDSHAGEHIHGIEY
jgi:hypothetical protein